MEPVLIIGLSVAISAALAGVVSAMHPVSVCTPSRSQTLTGARGLDWQPPAYMPPQPLQAAQARARSNDPGLSIPWRDAPDRSITAYRRQALAADAVDLLRDAQASRIRGDDFARSIVDRMKEVRDD